MKKFTFLSLVCTTLVGFAAPSYLPQDAQSCVEGETPSTVSIRHREHEGIGYKTGYTTLDVFFTPNWVRNFQPFFNARGHVMNDGKFAANVGIGARGAPIEKLAIGGNFFFDYREVSGMPAYQLGSGIEILSPYVDFRVNGYLPVGHKTKTYQAAFSRFSGNEIFLKQRFKGELATVYAELGAPIPYMPEQFQLYVAAGPYYIGHRHVELVNGRKTKVGDKWGGKYRLASRIYDYFEAGIELTHDTIFKTNVQGYIGVTLPLGPSKLYRGFKKNSNGDQCGTSRKFRRMMSQPVIRNEIVPVIDEKLYSIPATNAAGEVLDCIFVNLSASAGGNGTFENPFQTLFQAEAGSDPGDCIIVFEGGGIYQNEFITLQEGQIFAGAHTNFNVDGVTIGPFDTEEPVIRLDSNVSEFIIQLAENNLVQGFDLGFNGLGAAPRTIIDAGTVGNFVIEDVSISGSESYGILGGFGGFMEEGTKVISNVFISGTGITPEINNVGAIYLAGVQGTLLIDGGRISVIPSTGGDVRNGIYYDTASVSGFRSLTIQNVSFVGQDAQTEEFSSMIFINPAETPQGSQTITIENNSGFSSHTNIALNIEGQSLDTTYNINNNTFGNLSDNGGALGTAPTGLRFVSSQNEDVRSVINMSGNTFTEEGLSSPSEITINNAPSDQTCLTMTGTIINGDLTLTNSIAVPAEFVVKSAAGTQGGFEAANTTGGYVYSPGGSGDFSFENNAFPCPIIP